MDCPKCESKTGVKETRATENNYTYRRRRCKNKECGYRFSTIEIEFHSLEKLHSTAESLSLEETEALVKLRDEIQVIIDGKKICT